MGDSGQTAESAHKVTAADEEVAEIFGTSTPNARTVFALRLRKEGIVLFDGLKGAERKAAEQLIASRAVEVHEDGFTYITPLRTSILNIVRGQLGSNNLVDRWARGETDPLYD